MHEWRPTYDVVNGGAVNGSKKVDVNVSNSERFRFETKADEKTSYSLETAELG